MEREESYHEPQRAGLDGGLGPRASRVSQGARPAGRALYSTSDVVILVVVVEFPRRAVFTVLQHLAPAKGGVEHGEVGGHFAKAGNVLLPDHVF